MRGCWLFLCALAFAMCTDVNEGSIETPEDIEEDAYRFCLYVTVSGAEDDEAESSEAGTRAGTRTYQTEEESEINTLTVFFTDINDDGSESDVSFVRTFDFKDIESDEKGVYKLYFRAHVVPGKKNVYIGANLRDEQIAAFKNGKDCTYSITSLGDDEMPVDRVMDIDSKGNGSNIVMFSDGAQEIEVPVNPNPDTVLEIENPFELYRVVSRVQLFVTTVPNNTSYSVLYLYDSSSENGDTYGWARRDSVHYYLNTTNKKLYLLTPTKTIDGTSYSFDPNFEASTFLNGADTYGDNFLFNDISKISNDKAQVDYIENSKAVANVNKINTNDEKSSGGIYCLENFVYNDTGKDDIDAEAYKVTTYMIIAVRFVPNEIWYGEKGELNNFSTSTYKEARNKLKDQQNSITNGTYWTRRVPYEELSDGEKKKALNLKQAWMYRFYNYSGMTLAIEQSDGTLKESDFYKHNGGFSFYTTYVDVVKNGSKGNISYKERKSWGVQRNYYYRVVVSSINGLGEGIDDSYINVTCESTPWTEVGSKDIYITPDSKDKK
jgi:hypothetical protein